MQKSRDVFRSINTLAPYVLEKCHQMRDAMDRPIADRPI